MVKLKRKNLKVYYWADSQLEVRAVENSLKYWVEGCEYSPSYRKGRWDGFYKFYNHRSRSFNYGLLETVIQALTSQGIKYVVEGRFEPIKITKPINTSLWAHQKAGVLSFLKTPYGIIEIPTRGGKTMLAAELINITGLKQVLFVVDSQLLFDQAVNDISGYLKIKRSDIGQIRGDIYQLKSITVAMIQTLQAINFGVSRLRVSNRKNPRALDKLKMERQNKRFRARQLEQYLKGVDFLIVDECHEYSSDERQGVIEIIDQAKGYLFLSATSTKSERPLDNIKIRAIAGPIVYKVPEQVLKQRGILAHEDILLLELDHSKNKNINLTDEEDYDDFERQIIISNERRNNIIINVIQICRHLQLKTLVLFQYIKHGQSVQQITGDELLTNETPVKRRIAVKNKFLKLKGGVLLATNIFNKGITLPEVQVLINAGAGLEKSNVIQKKGRTLGTTETKKRALTIDFIDISKYFGHHSLKRIEVYTERIGVDGITIFSSDDEDFYNDVREYLSTWKRG